MNIWWQLLCMMCRQPAEPAFMCFKTRTFDELKNVTTILFHFHFVVEIYRFRSMSKWKWYATVIFFFSCIRRHKALSTRSLMLFQMKSSYSQKHDSLCFCRSQPAQHLLSTHEVRPRQSAACWKIVADHLLALGCDNIIFLNWQYVSDVVRAGTCVRWRWGSRILRVRSRASGGPTPAPTWGRRKVRGRLMLRSSQTRGDANSWHDATFSSFYPVNSGIGGKNKAVERVANSANTAKFNVEMLSEKK